MAKAKKSKAKTKAKSKPKAKVTAKARAKPKAKAKVKAKPAAKPKAKAKVSGATQKTLEMKPTGTNGASIAPFALTETGPGKYSLLLTQFEPASNVFDAAGIEGGGYAWEGIAKHVVEVVAPEIAGRFGLDPEASMFCAYGEDRAALERLGAELARVFHDTNTLAAMIQEIGRDGFND